MNVGPLAVATLCLLSLSGCTSKSSPEAAAEHCDPDCGFRWQWALGNSTNLAMDLTFDLGADNICTQEAAFRSYTRAPRPLMTTFEIIDGVVFPGAIYGEIATTSVAGNSSTATAQTLEGAIVFYNRSLSGVWRVVAVGNDLSADALPDGRAPMSFNLTCARPFELLQASQSQDVRLWEAGFLGEESVAFRPRLPAVWATHERNGLVHLDAVPGQHVLMLAGNYEEVLHAQGSLRLTGSAVEEAWTIAGFFQTMFAAPPGAYDLHVDYDSSGAPDRLIGILGSFQEVAGSPPELIQV